MTNRFGNKPFAYVDDDKTDVAADLNARAAQLIAAGQITDTEYRSCFSLADLRKLVERAYQQPAPGADVAQEPTPGAKDCPCADCETKRQRLIDTNLGGLAKYVVHPRVSDRVLTPEEQVKFDAEQARRNRNFKPSSPTHM